MLIINAIKDFFTLKFSLIEIIVAIYILYFSLWFFAWRFQIYRINTLTFVFILGFYGLIRDYFKRRKKNEFWK